MTLDPTRDRPGEGLFVRSLTPAQCRAVADERARGVRAVTLADRYGVNRRTIYRAAAYGRSEWADVTVGAWHAEFVLTPEGPVRCTAWMALP